MRWRITGTATRAAPASSAGVRNDSPMEGAAS
jgi:hypothetical protein